MSNDLISRQAAIDALRTCQTYLFCETDPDKKISLESAEWEIEHLPSAQPEIVRCKDCEYYEVTAWAAHRCDLLGRFVYGNDYCAGAERREDEISD